MKRRTTPFAVAVRSVGIALVVAAVVKELRTPRPERRWHGELGGVVPYDFRIPTLERLRSAMWDPRSRVLTPAVFGVGWSVNVGRLLRLWRRRLQRIEE